MFLKILFLFSSVVAKHNSDQKKEKWKDHRKRGEMVMSMEGLSKYLVFSGDEDYEN